MSVRDDLLDAALTLLREQGIAALTQPRVAAAAGVKQSHLTYYFPTRADMMLAIAEYAIATLMDGVAQRVARERSPQDFAGLVTEVMIEGIPPRLIIGLIVAADAEPAIRVRLRALVGGVRKRITAMLQSAGLAHSADAAMLFHAALVGLAVLHQARLNQESTAEIRRGVDLLLQLMASPNLPFEELST